MSVNQTKIPDRSAEPIPRDQGIHTVIWGAEIESGDFIKLPRVLTRMGRYREELGAAVQPRHFLLMLNLAGRQFRDEPIRVTWSVLAKDLGVGAETVRKWAYELEKMNLLCIKRVTDESTKDRRNSFDLAPFIQRVKAAHSRRIQEKARLRQG